MEERQLRAIERAVGKLLRRFEHYLPPGTRFQVRVNVARVKHIPPVIVVKDEVVLNELDLKKIRTFCANSRSTYRDGLLCIAERGPISHTDVEGLTGVQFGGGDVDRFNKRFKDLGLPYRVRGGIRLPLRVVKIGK